MYPIEYFNCECGGKYDTTNKTKHMKTMKHKNWESLQKILIEHVKLKKLINHENLPFSQNHEKT